MSASADITVERTIEPGHPAFAGHFPGAPVLPGACVLALVLQAAEQHASLREALGAHTAVPQVKFLAPVGPGSRLVIALRRGAAGVGFEVRSGETLIARGQLAPAA
ncbi:MAG: 3-hydroxyacyl-ACP dehydratase [Burkholderiaceae bacterium]